MPMTRADEQRLIERAARGDRASAERLIREHQASVYAYIFRLCGRADLAEDVVQEAFVRVLTHLDRFDPRFRFSTWLFTIAKRLYLNARQKHRPVYDSDVVGGWGGGGDGPSESVAAREWQGAARCALDEALAELGEEQREVVVLFHQQSWPIALISDHLGIPEGTVKSHLHRSRKRLRKILEDRAAERPQVVEVWGEERN
ncbi:MAG: RNA polymerase sigma factor [Phycisphaerales bacterium]